jgi:C-terminal processing protease CtpA/Prc
VYSTAAGGAFDVTGIPPDIPVAVFGEADLQGGKDPQLKPRATSFPKSGTAIIDDLSRSA